MQPKRDPNDRRFWPVRLGGTSGFSTYHKQGKPSPYRYGALNPNGSLSTNPRPRDTYAHSVTDTAKQIDAETVRARARVVTLRLLDRLDEMGSSMDTDETVDALNATGRLALEKSSTVTVAGSVAHLHLDALRQLNASARVSNEVTVEDAHVLSDGESTSCTVSAGTTNPVREDDGEDGPEIVLGTA